MPRAEKKGFHVSSRCLLTATGKTVRPYGQILLSKRPFFAHSCALSRSTRAKKLMVGEIPMGQRTILMPVIHLTSAHHGDLQKRVQQIRIVYDAVGADSDSEMLVQENSGLGCYVQ